MTTPLNTTRASQLASPNASGAVRPPQPSTRRATRRKATSVALTALTALAAVAAATASVAARAAEPAGAGQPAPQAAMTAATAAVPARWAAPRPAADATRDLTRWWSQFDDPLLPALIDAAQAASPDVASAAARIAEARATGVAAGSRATPSLDASAGASRNRADVRAPSASTASAGLQASWELDLFGGVRAARDAAGARLAGSEAGWHDARVAVAAEVASRYLALRACEAQLDEATLDADSRSETARLTARAQQAGFESTGTLALTEAAAAQARSQQQAQRAQCEQAVQALGALTGWDDATLRRRLAERRARLPQPAALAVAEVPGQALAQRPDLEAAARALEAAAADVTERQAQERPRVSLSGSFGLGWASTGGATFSGSTWSIGPLQITVPILDGGTSAAQTTAARARYDEALAAYAARLRNAVREVESALVRLDSAAARRPELDRVVDGYGRALAAAETRQRAGLASRLEVEDLRRSRAAARSQQIETEREQVDAWVTLYRALGGGWQRATADTTAR